MRHSRTQRGGFSLLEILMATSILLASVVVLNQLVGVGYQNALRAQDLTTAQMLCESQLNELLAGAQPLANVDEETFIDHPGWVYSVRVEPYQFPGLTRIEVGVQADGTEKNRTQQFSLVRLVHNGALSASETGEAGTGFPSSAGGVSDFGLEGRQP